MTFKEDGVSVVTPVECQETNFFIHIKMFKFKN